MVVPPGTQKPIASATANIAALYVYPLYQSRQDYLAATGKEPPPFDPTRPPQRWEAPEYLSIPARVVVIPRVLSVDDRGNANLGPDGQPYFEPLPMLKSEAASVNIPLNLAANEPGTEVPEVPPPMRVLDPVEELYIGFGGIPMVRNKILWQEQSSVPTSFTAADRSLLKKIAAKLGISEG